MASRRAKVAKNSCAAMAFQPALPSWIFVLIDHERALQYNIYGLATLVLMAQEAFNGLTYINGYLRINSWFTNYDCLCASIVKGLEVQISTRYLIRDVYHVYCWDHPMGDLWMGNTFNASNPIQCNNFCTWTRNSSVEIHI